MARSCGSVAGKIEDGLGLRSVRDATKVANSCTLDTRLLNFATPNGYVCGVISEAPELAVTTGQTSNPGANPGLETTSEGWRLRYRAVEIGYFFARD